MNGKHFRLVTLGRIALLDPAGTLVEPVSKRRRKLALLAYLALSRRPVSRDAVVEMFWGEQEERRARHSLSDALSELRAHLGGEALESRSADLVLSPRAPLAVDAREFAAACEAGDFVRALPLYGGVFLRGLTIEDSPNFEDWLSRERDRLAQLFTRACQSECKRLKAEGQWEACAALAERWLEAAPLSADAALALLESLGAPDTSDAAQAVHAAYARWVALLSRDYDMEPDPAVAALAGRLTARTLLSPPSSLSPPSLPAPLSARPPVRLSALTVLLTALGVLAVGAVLLARKRPSAPGASGRPVVAVVAIHNLSRDTAAAWLEDGFKQMITANLSRSSGVDVVAPDRVRAVLARSGLSAEHDFSPEELRRIGRELGATWVVTGGFSRGENTYLLDVSLRDVASAAVTPLYAVTGNDPLAVADAAAVRVLDAADAGGSGPRFAGVETSSLDAYHHYMRALTGSAEGRFSEWTRELDAALALDSSFVSALVARMRGAIFEKNPELLARLRRRYDAARLHATPWDLLEVETQAALHRGEHARSEALGRELVARFPRDPRAYATLADVYSTHGKWEASDTVLQQELALDSLATVAGSGPCAPCTAYYGLIGVRVALGRLPEAEHAARRWVELQPELPSSWAALAMVLSFEGKFDEGLSASLRVVSLAPEDPEYSIRIGRLLLSARRYDALDSAFVGWRRASLPGWEEAVLDLQALRERELGQLRASVATIDRLVARYPRARVLLLEKGNSLGRLGRYDEARRLYEAETAHSVTGPVATDLTPGAELLGDDARAFCWGHALEAEAIAEQGDTGYLRALADSIERIGHKSYYGRDWVLGAHVRGLIAERQGRWGDAAKEFRSALWSVAGFTRTNVHLALAELKLGHPERAIAVLRDAYGAPLDAMGRYQPRSELDYLMAVAFKAANRPDSAAVYAAHVRRAWRNADPEVRAKLADL